MFDIADLMPPPERPAAVILPFQRPDARDADAVAAFLVAMDAEPIQAPVILAARGLDGVHYVGASVAGRAFRLTPAEARLAADTLWADPGAPGFGEVAARLREAAEAAARGASRAEVR